ncbi:MAG: conjugal transfer protein TraG N-terminal domain-containing protein, partial [Proteobacteria bacterium]|nr:conjugal transfer protein TraG N-terminal domain-containing protein [Pseudomonadota bacterium]
MLATYSYLEFYLTQLAWIINNGIWYALAGTGLVAWPFIAIILQEWLRARGEGADEGNKGILSIFRVENRIYIAFVVILFACIPFIPVKPAQMNIDRTASTNCGVTVLDNTGVKWGGKGFESSIGGQTAQIPVWWALIHSLSKGITAAATAAIPCNPDIRQMMIELDEARIPNKLLLQEVADFSHD